MRQKIHRSFLFLAGAVLFLVCPPGTFAEAGVTKLTGTLADGATYLIEVPASGHWNGDLFLYSHGYVAPGSPNPAHDVGDPATRAFLLSSGFALAGSSYASTGWAIEQALPDQIAVLDIFEKKVGKPTRTIAWGHSLGGMITAGLIQRYPERFDAALPMCGVLSGGVATWNTALDSAFAFKTLVAPGSGLQIVNITDPAGNLKIAEAALLAAQKTPQGQAQLALVSALADIPGWFTPLSPEPAPTDFAGQELNQFLWAQQVDFPFGFALRAELEARAFRGNPSWNTGVDYRRQLAHSADADEVRALYRAAGLDLEVDLRTLNEAPRISANPPSTAYLIQNIIYNGEIRIPVLTMHTTGDGLVVVENESAYRHVVDEEGHGRFLRQTFVSRAGHCAFTPAETISALETLLERMKTGKWPETSASSLNLAATGLGPGLNIFVNAQGMIVPAEPSFTEFRPRRYLRPFDAESEECEFGFLCGDSFSPFDRH